ncbi:MAG: response regulator transcription factor [Steroidobacteraceae bacterium]|jgi:DNA-binding NarL/FixJ family response regulator
MTSSHAQAGTVAPPQAIAAGKRRARRVLIVDDHPLVRHGLRHILEGEEDLAVCGEAQTAHDTRSAIGELLPDALICEINLRHVDGMELVRMVREQYPRLPILVLSAHDENLYAERTLSAGASGYIMKQAPSEQFLASLRRVLDGQVYVSEAVGRNLIRGYAAGNSTLSPDPVDRLSNRELQILHMIGEGMSTRETAVSLHLSIKTVESHRQRIKRKLNLRTGAQLVRYAVAGLSATLTARCARTQDKQDN